MGGIHRLHNEPVLFNQCSICFIVSTVWKMRVCQLQTVCQGWTRVGSTCGSGRVGSGRAGSKYLKCIIFSLTVELSKFSCNSQH